MTLFFPRQSARHISCRCVAILNYRYVQLPPTHRRDQIITLAQRSDASLIVGCSQWPSKAINASIGLFRSPTAALVGTNAVVFLKNGIDHRPGGFDRILAGEERTVAGHRVTEEPLVGGFLSRLFFSQIEFSLIADEFLSRALDVRAASAMAELGEMRNRR